MSPDPFQLLKCRFNVVRTLLANFGKTPSAVTSGKDNIMQKGPLEFIDTPALHR